MTWVKTDDNFAEDPRWESGDALAVHMAALGYCNRHGTDGRVSAKAARHLFAPLDAQERERAIQELLTAGFWMESDGGYEVVDFLVDQQSAAEVAHQRKLRAERQRRWAAKARASKGQNGQPTKSDGSSHVDASADGLGDVTPHRTAPHRREGVEGAGTSGTAPLALRGPSVPAGMKIKFKVAGDES